MTQSHNDTHFAGLFLSKCKRGVALRLLHFLAAPFGVRFVLRRLCRRTVLLRVVGHGAAPDRPNLTNVLTCVILTRCLFPPSSVLSTAHSALQPCPPFTTPVRPFHCVVAPSAAPSKQPHAVVPVFSRVSPSSFRAAPRLSDWNEVLMNIDPYVPPGVRVAPTNVCSFFAVVHSPACTWFTSGRYTFGFLGVVSAISFCVIGAAW